jgi:Amiloride-sensitive sodium channel
VKNQFCSRGTHIESIENYTNCNECLRVLDEIKIPSEDMFVECKFGDQVISCKDSFKELVFGYYLCYTFNGMKLFRGGSSHQDVTEEWNIDEGLKSTTSFNGYPRRALRAGPNFGLSILLRNRYADYDLMCSGASATMVTLK